MASDLLLTFCGDVCLQGIQQDTFSIAPEILDDFRTSDLTIGNLESPITTATEPIPYQAIHIKSPPHPGGLVGLCDVFSLANNHIMDYRVRGLTDTMQFLTTSGKQYFGAGLSREEALRPLTLTAKGHRLAFLAFSKWHRAGRRSPGAAPDDIGRVVRTVRQLHRDGYFVIVFPHWNYEYVDLPSPSSRRAARRLINAGADLVVGAHPHVTQPWERYRGKLICYSLGNFVFSEDLLNPPVQTASTVHQSLVLRVGVDRRGDYWHDVRHVRTDSHSISLPTEKAEAEAVHRLERLSGDLANDRRYTDAFYRQAAKVAREFGARMGQEIKKQGPMYILSRLHRIRFEDLRIRLYRT